MFYGKTSVEFRAARARPDCSPCGLGGPEVSPIEKARDIRQLRKLYSPGNNLPSRLLFGPQQ